MTVSVEIVRVAKSWPNNNQLECSDLPDDYVALLEVNLLHGTV